MGIVRIPKYCLHAPTGQAYVRIRGRMIYLGKHGSPPAEKPTAALSLNWPLRLPIGRSCSRPRPAI